MAGKNTSEPASLMSRAERSHRDLTGQIRRPKQAAARLDQAPASTGPFGESDPANEIGTEPAINVQCPHSLMLTFHHRLKFRNGWPL